MDAGDVEKRIKGLRDELQRADTDLVEAITRRQRLVETLAAVKHEGGVPVRDRLQEEAVLTRAELLARESGADAFVVNRIFRELIAHAVRVQEVREVESNAEASAPLAIGYQGADGGSGHAAARGHFSVYRASATFTAFATFKDLARATAAGEIDYGVLPIENSTAGSINETYDVVTTQNLFIVGEEIISLDHCLVATAPVAIASLRRVYSHPEALVQCSEFLASLAGCENVPCPNTALALEKLRSAADLHDAAIASEEAARSQGLAILARDIANQRPNLTRFVVLAARPLECGPRIACKTSIAFVARHTQGTLLQCLNALASRSLNLTKLESRPRPGAPWEYQFYVDFEGNAGDRRVQDALAELASLTLWVRVLGSFPLRTTRHTNMQWFAAATMPPASGASPPE